MKRLRITRFCFDPNQGGTFGELWVFDEENEHIFSCATLELPWRSNDANVSCIPAGTYFVKRGNFKAKYPNYEVKHVNGRSAIEMHRGNTVSDMLGCIVLGADYRIDSQHGKFWVTNSKTTFDEFMDAMNGDKWAVLELRENVCSTAHKAG